MIYDGEYITWKRNGKGYNIYEELIFDREYLYNWKKKKNFIIIEIWNLIFCYINILIDRK